MAELTPKQMALLALERMKGDDLERCRSRFRGLSADQMELPYGDSGKTRREILREAEDHARAVQQAIDWVNDLWMTIRWVPVTDRLPEFGVPVAIRFADGVAGWNRFEGAVLSRHGWQLQSGFFAQRCFVSHWHPIAHIPGGEERGADR